MKRAVSLLVCLTVIVLVAGSAVAREPREAGRRIVRYVNPDALAGMAPPGAEPAARPSLGEWYREYTHALYDFEDGWQGWTRVDHTAQPDTFWHVEDYAETELLGFPGPLSGAKSAWCGTLPGDGEYLCGWVAAPGYGNMWNQRLETVKFPFTPPLSVSFALVVDSEPDCDRLALEYDAGNDVWNEVFAWDGEHAAQVHSLDIPATLSATKLRFRFSSDGAWSDEDGMWPTNGAAHVDDISVTDDDGVIDFEDFESYADGTLPDGFWRAGVMEPFGRYSGLQANLRDTDPCNDNLSKQVVFFVGSDVPSGEFPGLFVTPFCMNGGGLEAPCQSEGVVSPPIDLARYSTGGDAVQDAPIPAGDLSWLGGVRLEFDWYKNLPFANLVFASWRIRVIDDGCPGDWRDRGSFYGGTEYDVRQAVFEIGDLAVDDGVRADTIQVLLEVIDMCDQWYDLYGDCAEHTTAPYYDNVRVVSYSRRGPQWSWRALELFQDNFPGTDDLESFVRADAANDLRPGDDPVIDPGDSAVVTCDAPLSGGIDTMAGGWPKVYCHVRCSYIGDPSAPKPDLAGPSLAGSCGRYDTDDGTWTVLQCDYARVGGNVAPDKYAIDLNDSLLTRGYMVEYYFSATDRAGETTTLPGDAASATAHRFPNCSHLFEFTCLPTLASDVLYVDDFHGIGSWAGLAEDWFDETFDAMSESAFPDRYDVNSPTSLVSNGPGSRARLAHLLPAYRAIVWDGGFLTDGVICDGTVDSDKSDDAGLLVSFLDNATAEHAGIWVLGDGAALDLTDSSAPIAATLLADWCGVSLVDDSYLDLTGGAEGGGEVAPKIAGTDDALNPLWHTTWRDSVYVFGGCPILDHFDVLEPTGPGMQSFDYPAYSSEVHAAGIRAEHVNSQGTTVRTMWFGFSWMHLRECEPASPMMRTIVYRDVMRGWLSAGESPGDITGEDDAPPAATALGRAWPNPFNPVTTIPFSLRERGRARLRIYDAAGRLVRTLVDEVRPAGAHEARWDGRNAAGRRASSGVYFCRFEAPGYEKTIKTVLLR